MSAVVYQTECPWGHPYEGVNLGISARNGAPFCRHCRRVSSRGTRRGGLTLAECYALYPEWRNINGPRLRPGKKAS